MWLRDSGVLDKLKYEIMRPPFSDLDPKVRRDQPLIMSQLGIVMIVLAVGLVLPIPVFLCELMKGKSKKTYLINYQDYQSRDLALPIDRENITLTEVAHLTLYYYGRSLEEYLA